MSSSKLGKTVTVNNFEYNDLSGNKHFVAQPNGWRKYGAIEVNKNGGSLIEKGSFAQVAVYCEEQSVKISKGGPSITLPEGSSEPWANDYAATYPEKPTAKWCVTIFQRQDDNTDTVVSYAQVTATSLASPQIFDLDPSLKNLYITINDSYYTPNGNSAFGDNSGTFEINVQLIAPTTPNS
jgi:hypothetical protein